MHSKKTALILLLALLLSFSLFLTACGGGDAAPASSAKPSSADAQEANEEDAEEDAVEGGGEEQMSAEEQAMIDTAKYFVANATASLIGHTSGGEDVVYICTPDIACFSFVNEDGQSATFIGPYEADDTSITVNDEASGLSFSAVVVEANEDGSFIADIGDLGQIGFVQADVETAVTALLLIEGLTEAVI